MAQDTRRVSWGGCVPLLAHFTGFEIFWRDVEWSIDSGCSGATNPLAHSRKLLFRGDNQPMQLLPRVRPGVDRIVSIGRSVFSLNRWVLLLTGSVTPTATGATLHANRLASTFLALQFFFDANVSFFPDSNLSGI